MKLRLSIGRAVNLFGLIVTLGCVAVLWTGISALSELKVGGPVYRQIVLGKDLIADILPPPEYVIESYLETTALLERDRNTVSARHREGRLGRRTQGLRGDRQRLCGSSRCRRQDGRTCERD